MDKDDMDRRRCLHVRTSEKSSLQPYDPAPI
jgi:hypothetical protein